MKFLKISVLLLVIFSIEGCIGNISNDLNRAESLMNEYPDSALNILENIYIYGNESDEYKAKHGLLLTQARYKNFIDEVNDSLIRSSSEYFLRRNEPKDAAMSLFLTGTIQRNAGKFGESAVSYRQALNLATKHHLYEIEGLSAKGLYMLYVKLFDGVNQIKYANESYQAFLKGGYGEWAKYAKLDIAIAYNNSGKYSRAVLEAMRVVQSCEKDGDTLLMAEAKRLIGLSQFALGKNKESIYSYYEANNLDNTVLTIDDKSNIMIAVSELNRDSIPLEINKMIAELKNEGDLYTPFEVYAKKGDYEKAYKKLELYKIEQDSVLSSLLRSNVSNALQSYEQNQQKLHKEKMKDERLLWGLVVIIVFITSALIIYVLRKHLQDIERRQEIIISNAECVRADLLRQIETNTHISESIKELFGQKYSVVNELCSAYYESKAAKNEKKRIVTEVELLVQDFSDNSNRLSELMEYADKYTNGLFSKFKKDFPKCKDEEYRLFLFLMMGFSARSISLFLGEKIEVIYNRKSRLKAKIKNSDISRKMDYLAYCDVSA